MTMRRRARGGRSSCISFPTQEASFHGGRSLWSAIWQIWRPPLGRSRTAAAAWDEQVQEAEAAADRCLRGLAEAQRREGPQFEADWSDREFRKNQSSLYRVSHRSMNISIREPNHGPQMGVIFRSPSTSKQSHRKCLIQSSRLPLRLVFDLTRRQICPCRIVSRMDQRSIVLCLPLKGLSAHAIHDDLAATLGLKAVAYIRVTGSLREPKFGTAEAPLDPEPSSSRLDDFGPAILTAREEKPFSSVRELVRATHIPRATIHRRLTKLLGFVRRLPRGVPHLLSGAQSQAR
jgi:hypothetical protein